MSKVEALEMEENEKYQSELEDQLILKQQYEEQEKNRSIQEAITLLENNGYIVAKGKDETN